MTDDEKLELVRSARTIEVCLDDSVHDSGATMVAKKLLRRLADALEGTLTEPEWRTVVLGREEATDSDSNWQVTAWMPEEIDEARTSFPRSEYKLARMALDEGEVVTDDRD